MTPNSKNFRNSLNTSSEPPVSPYPPETEEYALWLSEQYHNNCRPYLDRLNVVMVEIAEYLKSNFPDTNFSVEGRIKSKSSTDTNLGKGKNLFDIVAMRAIVNSVKLGYSPQSKVRDALGFIEQNKGLHIDFQEISTELRRYLRIYETHNKGTEIELPPLRLIGKTSPKTYTNSEVLLVDGILSAIEKLRSIKTLSPEDRRKIIDNLENAISATNYGTSIEMSSSLIKYLISEPGCAKFVSERYKTFDAEHNSPGKTYVAEHLSFIDTLYSIPFEFQFTTKENAAIAETGSSAHQNRVGKERELPLPKVSSDSDEKMVSQLVNHFSQKELKSVVDSLPLFSYCIMENLGLDIPVEDKIKTNNMWENFEKHYSKQIGELFGTSRMLLFIGLQLSPELRGHLPANYYEGQDRFPYNLLPIIEKIAIQRDAEKDSR